MDKNNKHSAITTLESEIGELESIVTQPTGTKSTLVNRNDVPGDLAPQVDECGLLGTKVVELQASIESLSDGIITTATTPSIEPSILNSLDFSDYVGLCVAAVFGGLAIWFFLQQKKQGKEFHKLQEGLESEVNRLADISRPYKKTFPEIIAQIRELCDEALANKDQAEFFIMNRTSAFGAIHIYNPSFQRHYQLDSDVNGFHAKKIIKEMHNNHGVILLSFESKEDECRYLFQYDVSELHEKLKKCRDTLSRDNIKLVTYSGNRQEQKKSKLETAFIKPYYEKVNSDQDIEINKGLLFFEYKNSVINCCDEKDTENKITEAVLSKHNDLAGDDFESAKWCQYSESIPVQMYLLKTKINGKYHYKTFVINAMDVKVDEGNDIDRHIDGLLSREQSIYEVFKTLFNEQLKKGELT